jgi:hypothetical protein
MNCSSLKKADKDFSYTAVATPHIASVGVQL